MNEVVESKKKFDLITYLKGVRAELGKIHWPSRKETTTTTIMVFVMAAIVAVFLFVVDQIVAQLIQFILGINS